MKKCINHTILKLLAVYLLVICTLVIGGASCKVVEADTLNGVCCASDGNWYYFIDGVVQKGETIQGNEYGWWYINADGMVDFNYSGVASNQYGKWYVEKGKVKFNYNGFAKDASGDWWYFIKSKAQTDLTSIINGDVAGQDEWWYVKSGKVTFDTTVASNDYGTWYIEKGYVTFDKDGFVKDSDGNWWYCKGSKVKTDLTTIMLATINNKNEWWYVNGGKVIFDTTVASNEYGTWYIENGYVTFDYDGFAKDSDGNWWYCKGSKVKTDLTTIKLGTVNSKNEWWYIKNGKVVFDTTVASNEYGTWYIENGYVTFDYNGFAKASDGNWWYCKGSKVKTDLTTIDSGVVNGKDSWWYIVDGKVSFTTTIDSNQYGWWYIEDGEVTFTYTGIAENQYGTWYCKKSKVSFDYTGFAEDEDGNWWYCIKSKVQKDLTSIKYGTVDGESGWWYIANGKVTYKDTVAKNEYGWWYVEDGQVTFDLTDIINTTIGGVNSWYYFKDSKFQSTYSGFMSNQYGWWYVVSGKVDFTYNGIVYGTVNGQTGNWKVISNSPQYVITSEVLIANCGKDENGQYRGGVAGDQTGKEWCVINWYNYPWNYVLRYTGTRASEVRALMVKYASAAAANDHIGYDQTQRNTFWNQLVANGYNPANITVDCETDCSAGVVAIVKAVGYTLNIQALKDVSIYAYTGNLQSILEGAGFTAYSSAGYISMTDYLMAGDVLLNTDNHTTICVSSGEKAGETPSNIQETYEIKYSRNSTVQENSSGSTVKTLQEALNLLGYKDNDGYTLTADGSFGPKTKEAVENFQRNNGLEVDGVVGGKTWAKIGAAIDNL